MPRLEKGVSAKIDRINDMVATIQGVTILSEDGQTKDECLEELLSMFKPMILSVCKKWSDYFNDSNHSIKAFNDLVVDSEYWFYYYTTFKYTIDGSATYNKFIKDHIDQRIRYIYECELKYHKQNIFPDPDRTKNDDIDMFESVVYKYGSDSAEMSECGTEENFIDDFESGNRKELVDRILSIINNNPIFNAREREIFIGITYKGTTYDDIGKSLNISRTRVKQILSKTKTRLYKIMNNDQTIWDLVYDSDIEFKEIDN